MGGRSIIGENKGKNGKKCNNYRRKFNGKDCKSEKKCYNFTGGITKCEI